MSTSPLDRLRRDLGVVEAYAVMVGTLVGAGIFRVTSDAWSVTGSSVILGYLVLAPIVCATSIPYAAFLSTSLGREPGGEYAHVGRATGIPSLAFLCAWLKIISYLGALAFLSLALADYALATLPFVEHPEVWQRPVALAALVFFYAVHAAGVRWFGRLQVALCLVLAASIVVLVVPGLFAIRIENYTPFFNGGSSGFFASLPPLFFAYAGFECVAHVAGEMRDSTTRLPRVFLRGILLTTGIFLAMSVVAFGVLPGHLIAGSGAPMTDVASVYLPRGSAWIITLGALAALATSVNGSLLVPARLGLMLARDGFAPAWLGSVSARRGTPIVGMTVGTLISAFLIVTGQIALALNVAVFALILLYLIHSLSLLALPRTNPALFAEVCAAMTPRRQRLAALFSSICLAALVVVQVRADALGIAETSFAERLRSGGSTALELLLAWGALGLVLFRVGPSRLRRS